MPIYNFRCKNKECNHITKVKQKFSDPDPVCEKCGDKGVERVIISASFSLKGDGWFNTGGY